MNDASPLANNEKIPAVLLPAIARSYLLQTYNSIYELLGLAESELLKAANRNDWAQVLTLLQQGADAYDLLRFKNTIRFPRDPYTGHYLIKQLENFEAVIRYLLDYPAAIDKHLRKHFAQ